MEPGQTVLEFAETGEFTMNGKASNLDKLKIKLERDKAQGISTPIKLYSGTNVDFMHVGTVMEVIHLSGRSADAVVGN